MTEKITFQEKDRVRFELAPDGTTTRWIYDPDTGWIDRGYSGRFLEGVIASIYESDTGPMMSIEGSIPDTEANYRIRLPLEGNLEYVDDLYQFPGMPVLVFRDVSELECECGEDSAVRAGATPGRHSEWCKKYIPLSW